MVDSKPSAGRVAGRHKSAQSVGQLLDESLDEHRINLSVLVSKLEHLGNAQEEIASLISDYPRGSEVSKAGWHYVGRNIALVHDMMVAAKGFRKGLAELDRAEKALRLQMKTSEDPSI